MTTKLEACREWVNEFNAIPQALIVKAYGGENIDELIELTPVTKRDRIWSNEYQGEFEVLSVDYENETAIIEVDGEETEVEINDISIENDDLLPMWGTMWTFGSNLDEEWARDNLEIMAKCGFRIYESDELGIYFGIDGAGYDFYKSHWLPLYKARGLHWHDEE
jgi:hypothetical protein